MYIIIVTRLYIIYYMLHAKDINETHIYYWIVSLTDSLTLPLSGSLALFLSLSRALALSHSHTLSFLHSYPSLSHTNTSFLLCTGYHHLHISISRRCPDHWSSGRYDKLMASTNIVLIYVSNMYNFPKIVFSTKAFHRTCWLTSRA
jgi:hypothetical protein